MASIEAGMQQSASDTDLQIPHMELLSLSPTSSSHGHSVHRTVTRSSTPQPPASPEMLEKVGATATTAALKWKALIRRGRARRALLEQLFEVDAQFLSALPPGEDSTKKVTTDRERERERLLQMARQDFNEALAIDPNETARFEVDSLLAIDTKIPI